MSELILKKELIRLQKKKDLWESRREMVLVGLSDNIIT